VGAEAVDVNLHLIAAKELDVGGGAPVSNANPGNCAKNIVGAISRACIDRRSLREEHNQGEHRPCTIFSQRPFARPRYGCVARACGAGRRPAASSQYGPPAGRVGQEQVDRQRVEHVGGTEPALSGHPDAVLDVGDAGDVVGVGADRDGDTARARAAQHAPVEIQPVGVGVDLQRVLCSKFIHLHRMVDHKFSG